MTPSPGVKTLQRLGQAGFGIGLGAQGVNSLISGLGGIPDATDAYLRGKASGIADVANRGPLERFLFAANPDKALEVASRIMAGDRGLMGWVERLTGMGPQAVLGEARRLVARHSAGKSGPLFGGFFTSTPGMNSQYNQAVGAEAFQKLQNELAAAQQQAQVTQ